MANAFDAFDTKPAKSSGGNAFDAFDADFSGVKSRVIPNEEPGFLRSLGSQIAAEWDKGLVENVREMPGEVLGLGESLARGVSSGLNRVGSTASFLTLPVAKAMDSIARAGGQQEGFVDDMGRLTDAYADESGRVLAADPRASAIPNQIMQAAGGVAPDLAMALMTGGETAAVQPLVQQTVRQGVARAAEEMIGQGARASIAPSLERGTELGTQVIGAGGTVPEALGAFGTGASGTALTYMLPGAATGPMALRAAEGAVVEPLGGYLQQQGENLALDDRLGLDQQYDAKQAFMDVFLGGGLAAGLGRPGPEAPAIAAPQTENVFDLFDDAPAETAIEPQPIVTPPVAPVDVDAPYRPPVAEAVAEVPAVERPAIELPPEPAVAEAAATPEPPAAERLYADYNPEAPQTETRVDGNLSFPESRLTRRALDDALETAAADPVAGTERLLTNLAEQPDIRPEQKWLAEKLAPLMRELEVKLVPPNPDLPYAGAYNNTDNTVWARQADPETVLHETFHGATSALITSKAARANPVVKKAVGELDDMLGHLTGSIGLGEIDTSGVHPEIRRLLDDKQGPLSNTKEFVTYGMTNRPFQDFLKTLPPPPGREQARNMWEYFKQAVISLFGKVTPSQRSFLDALIESGADLVEFAAANPKATRVAQAAEAGKFARADTPPVRPTPEVAPAKAEPPNPPASRPTAEPPKRPLTSLKNESVREQRESRGEEPVGKDKPQSNEATLERAQDVLDANPDAAQEIIERMAQNPQGAVSVAEQGVLLLESERVRAERQKAEERAANLSLTPEQRAVALRKVEELNAAVTVLDQATTNVGTIGGRLLQFRQRALKEDFTLAALERKAIGVKGAALTTDERAELKAIAQKFAAAQKEVETLQAKLDQRATEQDVAATYKRLLEDLKKPRRPDVAALRKKAEAARKTLRELAGTDAAAIRGEDPAVLSPEQALIDIGAFHYASGATDKAAWLKAMEQDVPEQFRKGLDDLYELSKTGAAKPVLDGELTRKQVADLVAAQVRAGKTDLDALMKAVTADVQAAHPEVTEKDVRRLFSDYGKQKFPSKDADKKKLGELRQMAKMEEAIKDMEAGLRPMKSGLKKEKASAELAEKRAAFARAQRQFNARYPDPDADAKYQASRATSIARQISDVRARILSNDYEKAVRIPKELNDANTKAAFELEKIKEQFLRFQFEQEMAKRSPLRKILGAGQETLNLARAIMTSFDLSAVLRQGGFISLGNPTRAAKAFIPMMKAFASKEGEFKVRHDIETRPNAKLYKAAGLELTDIGSGLNLSKMEEAFMSRWIEKIPKAVGGGFLRGSQRAFTTFLNKLRADSFDAMVASLARSETPTLAEAKAIANYINVATGRGKIGLSANAATGLNTIFFAPKLVASRFNLLAGQPLYGGTMRTRNMVAREYARFLAGVAVVMGLGALAHDEEDDDKPFVNFDPRSSDFGKMRFGQTYIDPLAGLAQVTTFLARELSGESVTGKGEVVPLRDQYRLTLQGDEKVEYGAQNAYDVATRFLRTKLAPIPGAIVNAFTGEDVVGNEATPGSIVTSLVVPLSMQNVRDVMAEHGVPAGTSVTMLELLGMGVQHRDPAQLKAPDYNSMSREERTAYGAYEVEANKIKAAKQSLQDFANGLPPETAPADMRYEVEKKAAELGLEGATVDVYKRDTTARNPDTGQRMRGVKRTEAGNVKLNFKEAWSLKGYSAAEKSVSAIDDYIEELDSDKVTNADVNRIWGKFVSEPLVTGDAANVASEKDKEEVLKVLRLQRKLSQEGFVRDQQ